MLHNLNITLKRVILFVLLFLLASPLGELTFIKGTRYDDGDLELYSISIFLAFSLTYILINTKYNNVQVYQVKKIRHTKIFFFTTVIAFLWFAFFVSKNAGSIAGLPVFAAKYRVGMYKGSGIYTFPILTIMPSVLTVFLIKIKKIDRFFIYSIILVFIATFIVGQRIYLFGIFFFFMLRLFFSASKKRIAFIFLPILISMMSYKYYLNEETSSLSQSQATFYFLGRLNLRSLLEFNGLNRDFSELKCAFFPINYFYDCNNENFKEQFLSGQEDVYYGMPYISNYSGVAIPLPVILYNLTGVFSVLFLVPYLLLLLFFITIGLRTKSLLKAVMSILIANILVMALVEDINVLNKTPIMLIVGGLVYYFIKKQN